ncbi:hypothetical protein CLM62_06490 [Streptomyces sp. SA15]|uniref:hypothetical protein n=1 Tax=Streptomyces sp. SA15 TaxID=934019 RepID=UPI000BB02C58|nr:hypothetical protein [Streptomyces sp. SA15]PAZ16594.1 hypothetical protein CLM62_06490 [Streptomyces sp. SA15]
MEPITTRDPAAAALAYLALEWPLAVGYRYRPRQGCTCGNVNCDAPGAHPFPQWRRLTPATVPSDVQTAPGAGLIARTHQFDAVLVPRSIGMAAMVQLDRKRISPPCLLLEPDLYAMLVLPATGRYTMADDVVEVRTGRDGWIPLPPSHGVRWDTAPWYEGTTTPRDLVHGSDVGPILAEGFKFARVREASQQRALKPEEARS